MHPYALPGELSRGWYGPLGKVYSLCIRPWPGMGNALRTLGEHFATETNAKTGFQD